MSTYYNGITDETTFISNGVLTVDANAAIGYDDLVNGTGPATLGAHVNALADRLAERMATAGIARQSVGGVAVVAILAALGMSRFGIEQHAAEIAVRIRKNAAYDKGSDDRLTRVAIASVGVMAVRDNEH